MWLDVEVKKLLIVAVLLEIYRWRLTPFASHPDIKKYQDQELFKKFNLEYGEIEWNDYDLVFPVYDLYQGRV